VTQEAFLRAWRARSRLDPNAPFAAWLRRVAVNASIDHLRRRRRQRWWPWASLPLREKTPDEPGADRKDDRLSDEVHRALQELPEHYRAVAVLREVDGLSYNEIAEVLACSVGTVRSRLARAREQLRRCLKHHFPQP